MPLSLSQSGSIFGFAESINENTERNSCGTGLVEGSQSFASFPEDCTTRESNVATLPTHYVLSPTPIWPSISTSWRRYTQRVSSPTATQSSVSEMPARRSISYSSEAPSIGSRWARMLGTIRGAPPNYAPPEGRLPAGDPMVTYFDPEVQWGETGGSASLPQSLFSIALICPLLGPGYSGKVNPAHLSCPDAASGVAHDRTPVLNGACCRGDADGQYCITECLGTWIVFLLPWYAALAASVAAQVVFIYFLGHETERIVNECNDNTSVLRLAAVLVLTIYCIADLAETARMAVWTLRMPSAESSEILQLIVDSVSRKPTGYASGISRRYKALVIIGILLPKLAIGALLWWYGTDYISNSPDNGELILNTVAVVFVLEIDDQLFKVTVPARLADRLNDLPSLPIVHGGHWADCITFLGQYLSFAVVGGMTYSVLASHCE